MASYQTWQEEFDRHVKEGKSAIWIWAPIITKQCPECENSPSYHGNSDCDYDETLPEEWSEALVGFKPAPVFDVPQTEGEPLPDLDMEATGAASDLVSQLAAAADEVGVTVRIVPDEDWTHGESKGICEQLSLDDVQPLVEVRDRENDADLARTLIRCSPRPEIGTKSTLSPSRVPAPIGSSEHPAVAVTSAPRRSRNQTSPCSPTRRPTSLSIG